MRGVDRQPLPGRDDAPFEGLGRLARAAMPPPGDELTVARAGFLDGVDRGARRRTPLLVGCALALGLSAGLIVLGLDAPAPRTLRATVPPVSTPVESATLAGGTMMRFQDGSELVLQPAARGRLGEVTASGAHMVLEQGGLDVRVTPRPEARWVVQAGPFTVKVTGTAFHVRWDATAQRLELDMTTGRVVVSGPRFEQPLTAGQQLVATADAGIVSLRASDDRDEAEEEDLSPLPPPSWRVQPPAEGPRAEPPVVGRPSRQTDWPRRVGAGDFGSVVAEAEAEGIALALRRRSLADLQALAIAARLAHRGDLARQVLLVERSRFGHTEAAHDAAFHLGRLAEDLDGNRSAAVGWYDRYLAERPDGLLAAEALGRKMVALQHDGGGQRQAAEAAARQYLARFPGGAYAGFANKILESR